MNPQQQDDSPRNIMQSDWFKEMYKGIKEQNANKGKQVPLNPPQPEEDTTDNGYRCLSEQLYTTLPEMLREPAMRFTDGEERELFLIGALGVVSGMLPHYTGNYFGSQTGANLYCFIIGRYGTGKGSLKWARMLGEIIHLNRLDEAKEQITRYQREKAHYNLKLSEYNKGKLAEPPEEPAPPRHLKLFIPANTTKTAVMQLLEENDGNGIIFETEGDTLADMLRQDYGNFSDILRKAYHHETVSFFRRANSEDVTVNRPALSVVLSGTHDQLLKLIPNIDNGLYSRFMFYILQGNDEFRNPFSQNDFTHAIYMERYASKYAELYTLLNKEGVQKQFEMNAQQQERFVHHYRKQKEWTQENISADLDGSVNRMALMAYRIAMILTILRYFEHNAQLPAIALKCTDTDLQAALDIMDVLSHYATDVYNYLAKNGLRRAENSATDTSTDEQKMKCYKYHNMGWSERKIAVEVFGNVNSRGRVGRILKDYGIK